MKPPPCLRVIAMCSLVLAGCKVETIVAGTLALDAGADDDAAASVGCRGPDDCAAGELCEKRACADARGLCMPIPRLCTDAHLSPVCGCDGITYFNDCLRRRSGIASARPEPCEQTAQRCVSEREQPCPEPAVCGRLPPRISIGSPGVRCEPEEPGQCWVVPVSCDRTLPGDRFGTCDGTLQCLDLCSALRSGQALTLSMQCDSASERDHEIRSEP
jgi:hypothetical protein